jgi:hypothetical protein
VIGSTRTSPIRMGWSSARRSCHVIPYRARRYEKTESDQSPGPVCSMLPKATSPFKYKSTRPGRIIRIPAIANKHDSHRQDPLLRPYGSLDLLHSSFPSIRSFLLEPGDLLRQDCLNLFGNISSGIDYAPHRIDVDRMVGSSRERPLTDSERSRPGLDRLTKTAWEVRSGRASVSAFQETYPAPIHQLVTMSRRTGSRPLSTAEHD